MSFLENIGFTIRAESLFIIENTVSLLQLACASNLFKKKMRKSSKFSLI